MRRYFVRIPDIAAAESDAAADRLIIRGYLECGHSYYMQIWRLRDEARLAQLTRQAAREWERKQPRISSMPIPIGNGWYRYFV